MDSAAVHLDIGSPSDIDRVRPLWLTLHRHHQALLPFLAPYVDDDRSWAIRRGLYLDLLAKPDTTLLFAVLESALVGYGLAHVVHTRDTWVADTWQTGDRIGEIESLGVVPEMRGRGVGTQLLDALIGALTQAGVSDLVLGVVPGNRAINLYERFGFRTTWSYMSRFDGRR
jgi:ribosomal protein S18 acetylase RimI-like enzyme